MKVLALNSSLRQDGESRTELMLDHLVKGMRGAGADVEVVNMSDKNVQYCMGCFSCDTITPGKCIIQDDMSQELYPKWMASDLCVYATPLFYWTMNAPMKAFIERTWPVMQPFFVQTSDGRWVHPVRHELPKAVVLSVAGFAESWIFESLSNYVNFLWGRSGKLVAEIYRPGAMFMTSLDRDKLANILGATEQAGHELVLNNCVLPETLARIQQPIGDLDTIAKAANMFWQTCIDEGINPKAFGERVRILRAHSLEDYLILLKLAFSAKGARDAKATVQFEFTGAVAGDCYIIIDSGVIQTGLGEAPLSDVIIRSPFELWMDIISGKASAIQMFLEGKCSAEGNLSLLMKMSQWFGLAP
jgi:multimeric flavodoxin WrbA/putative sterol carrier protein